MSRQGDGPWKSNEAQESQPETKLKTHVVIQADPWPGEIEVVEVTDLEDTNSQRSRGKVIRGLAISFVLLLFMLAGYAMIAKDHQLLSEVLVIDKVGLLYVGVWAVGRSALEIFRHNGR
jgi:hypothetical protein